VVRGGERARERQQSGKRVAHGGLECGRRKD
jgi:hypothetical protein